MTAPDRSVAYTHRTGTVEGFDDHVGAGTVRDGDDGQVWPFHCTRILGGIRTIAVGTAVAYRIAPGPTGLEAVDLSPR